MGWGNCGTDTQDRPIGYVHSATCDHPGCKAEINRGLSYACGGMHGPSPGCERYFCSDHLTYEWEPGEQRAIQICMTCAEDLSQAAHEDYLDLLYAAVREPRPAPDFKPIKETQIDVYVEGHFSGSLIKEAQFDSWQFKDQGFSMSMGRSAAEAVSLCINHFVQAPLSPREHRRRIMETLIHWDDDRLHLLPAGTGLLSKEDEARLVAAKTRQIKIEPNKEVMERLRGMAVERNSKVVIG